MKLRQLSAAALLLLASFVHAAAETCSCAAEDGSCTMRITCPGGCFVFCPSDGCTGQCMEFGTDQPNEDPQTTATPEGSSVKAEMSASKRVTIEAVKADGRQVAAELTRVTDRKIEFTPRRASERFNFDFRNVELWNVLSYLSDFGTVKLDGTDFEQLKKIRRGLAGNQKMSVCIREASVRELASTLSFLSGVPLSVNSGGDNPRITASLKGVTLSEIIASISDRAGVEIVKAGDAPAKTEPGGGIFLSIILPLVLPLIMP